MGDLYIGFKLVFVDVHIIAPLDTGQCIGTVFYGTKVLVIGLLGVTVKFQFIRGQGHGVVAKYHTVFGNGDFGLTIVIHISTVHTDRIALLKIHISVGPDFVFSLVQYREVTPHIRSFMTKLYLLVFVFRKYSSPRVVGLI